MSGGAGCRGPQAGGEGVGCRGPQAGGESKEQSEGWRKGNRARGGVPGGRRPGGEGNEWSFLMARRRNRVVNFVTFFVKTYLAIKLKR